MPTKEVSNPKRIKVYSFSLPAVPFGGSHVPVLTMIRHPLKLSIGKVSSQGETVEGTCKMELMPIYQLYVDEGRIRVAIKGNVRSVANVENVFIVHRKFTPLSTVKYEIPLMDDLFVLKIVSMKAFEVIYESETHSALPGKLTDSSVIKFVISKGWATESILTTWNKDVTLRWYLPYTFWLS